MFEVVDSHGPCFRCGKLKDEKTKIRHIILENDDGDTVRVKLCEHCIGVIVGELFEDGAFKIKIM